jgi:triacylglycerol lipase
MAEINVPPGFDLPIALEAAELVMQAYEQFAAFKAGQAWSIQGDYTNLGAFSAKAGGLFTEFDRPEPFGFVAQNNSSKNVFATFRGTETPEDWLSNIAINQSAHPWGPVEEGFAKLYAQCSSAVLDAVKRAGAARVVSTGHSLGGALSTLAAADLAINQVAVQLYNFASPRTGSPSFAGTFNQKIASAWRTVNTEDLVTTVPLSTPNLGSDKPPHGFLGVVIGIARKLDFEHVGSAVSFTSFNGSILTNHQMLTYLTALTAARAQAAAA